MKNIIPTLLAILVPLIATANAGRQFYHVYGGLNKRQINPCGYGDNCVEACGAGFINCFNTEYCFNPSAGDTCCAHGGGISCPSGQYCVSIPDGGASCCPVGDSLAQCHASVSVNPVATDATLASLATGASASGSAGASSSGSSSPPSSSSPPGGSKPSSNGAQITDAAVMFGAEVIGLAAAGLAVALPFL